MINIALKDLKIFVRDFKAVLLTFLLPIILITLFGLAFGGLSERSGKQSKTSLFIADLDSTGISKDVINKLNNVEEISLVPIGFEKGKEEIMNGNKLAMSVFYKGFAESVENGGTFPIELFYDEARKMEAGLVQYALISNLMKIVGPQSIKTKVLKNIRTRYPGIDDDMMSQIENDINQQFDSEDKSGTQADKQLMPGNMGGLTITGLARKESVNWALIQSFAGTAVMMLLFSVSAIGTSLLSERDDGTLKRLMFSPISPSFIMLGKVFYALVISTLQLTIMLVYTWLVLGLDLGDNLFFTMLMIIATAFACSGFGVLIASLSTSRKQAEGLSTIFILIMSAIGGSMIPIFFMPAFMQKMAVISLNYWAIQGFFDVLGREASTVQILSKILILTGIGVFLMVISASLFKRNLSKVV